MDIRLVKTLPGSPDLPLIRALNAEAFPLEERISVTYMMHGLRVPDQELLAIHADGRFAGFFSMILLGRCAYICYFAILPRLRSMGIGSAALRALAAHYPDHQVVVDFEAPDDAAPNNAIRLRRRAFYLRNGFHPTGYYQFYMETEFEIACTDPVYDRPGYEALVAAIHDEVPDFDPHHYRKD